MFLGMLTWALRKHLRDPLPDFSQSPLETMNNIFRIELNENENEPRAGLSAPVHQTYTVAPIGHPLNPCQECELNHIHYLECLKQIKNFIVYSILLKEYI